MKRIKISLILNILIVIMVTVFSIFMFTGIKFMPTELLLESNGIEMLKFYTVDSNILLGIVSFVMALSEIKAIKNKKYKIPEFVYILKYIGVSGIAVTFIITLLFLAPMYGFYAMYNNNNLFFHLIIPIVSFISYIGFEHHKSNYKYALYGMMPMVVYSVFYTLNIITHLEVGGLTFKYDFYGFLRGNINNIVITIPVIYIGTYLISLLILFLNKKISK